MMLGMASVPLAALLQEPWVDRYAAVFAVMRQSGSEEEHKEQVRAQRAADDVCCSCRHSRVTPALASLRLYRTGRGCQGDPFAGGARDST